MSDIMKLADNYAQACYNLANPDSYDAERAEEARAALQSAIEALQKEVSTLDVLLEECKMDWSGDVTQLKAEHKHEIDAMGKGEPVAHFYAIERDLSFGFDADGLRDVPYALQAEIERLKVERENDAFRLVWAMNWMRMSVHDHGFTKHVLERGGIGDYSDCATYIDKCTTATQEAAHGIGGAP